MMKAVGTGNIGRTDRNLKRLDFHFSFLRALGPQYVLWLLKKTTFGSPRNRAALSKFSGKRGLEIGGPSQFFQPDGDFQIYSIAENIDNVNYSSRTFWEGSLREGEFFRYNLDKPAGYQFICEATALSAIPSDKYDFVASCHTLEHCANPIEALLEWRRVMKSDGWFAFILPHKSGTFDHQRNVTEFGHLLDDYRRGVTEDDATHFAEILEKHDLKLDPAQKSKESFEKWIKDNAVTRGAHHHVFDAALAVAIVDYVGFEVMFAEVVMPYHIFIVAQKSSKSRAEKERSCLQILESCCVKSPFKSDRQSQTLLLDSVAPLV